MHRAMSAASVDFPDRLRPSMPTSNGAVRERLGSTRPSMSDTGTIAHSVVAHLPLTAIHQRDAVFGRVPAAGMTRTNADGTAVFAVGPGALLHDRTRGLPPPPQGVAPLC